MEEDEGEGDDDDPTGLAVLAPGFEFAAWIAAEACADALEPVPEGGIEGDGEEPEGEEREHRAPCYRVIVDPLGHLVSLVHLLHRRPALRPLKRDEQP